MEYLLITGLIVLVAVVAIAVDRRFFRRSAQSDPTAVFGAPARAASEPHAAPADEDDPADATADDAEETAEQLLIAADGLYGKREYSDALDKYGEALDAAIDDKGQDDLIVATIAERQGDADLAVNGNDYDSDTIPTEYLRALSVRERVQGPFHADLIPVLRKLAAFYDRVGSHNDAEGLIRRLRDIEEAIERAKRETPPASA